MICRYILTASKLSLSLHPFGEEREFSSDTVQWEQRKASITHLLPAPAAVDEKWWDKVEADWESDGNVETTSPSSILVTVKITPLEPSIIREVHSSGRCYIFNSASHNNQSIDQFHSKSKQQHQFSQDWPADWLKRVSNESIWYTVILRVLIVAWKGSRSRLRQRAMGLIRQVSW